MPRASCGQRVQAECCVRRLVMRCSPLYCRSSSFSPSYSPQTSLFVPWWQVSRCGSQARFLSNKFGQGSYPAYCPTGNVTLTGTSTLVLSWPSRSAERQNLHSRNSRLPRPSHIRFQAGYAILANLKTSTKRQGDNRQRSKTPNFETITSPRQVFDLPPRSSSSQGSVFHGG